MHGGISNSTSAGQTLLSALEFRDGLCMRYGIEPPGLPSFCDGCGAPFSKEHAVQCRKGGLVIQRHNEIRDELGALCAAAFSASKVRNEPFIDLSPLLPSVGPAPLQLHLTLTPNLMPLLLPLPTFFLQPPPQFNSCPQHPLPPLSQPLTQQHSLSHRPQPQSAVTCWSVVSFPAAPTPSSTFESRTSMLLPM